MIGEPWFGPKRYGMGYSPANWKGWAFTLVMLAGIIAITRLFLPGHRQVMGLSLLAWVAISIPVMALKTKGKMRWRDDDSRDA